MKLHLIIFNVLVTLLTLVSGTVAQAENCHINARVTHIPPLFYKNKAEQWTGLTIDLTKVLLKEAGCSYDFEDINWARSLELMKIGQIDMMMNMSITEEREEYIHFIGPHNDETIQLLLKDSVDTAIRSLDDFKNLPGVIGYQPKTYFGKEFNDKLKNDSVFASKFEKTSSQKNNIEKLKLGRIIGILRQRYSGVSAENQLNITGNYKTSPFIIHRNLVYFGFSKKTVSPELLKRLDKAYKTAKSQNKFQQVIDSYKK